MAETGWLDLVVWREQKAVNADTVPEALNMPEGREMEGIWLYFSLGLISSL